MRTSNAIDPTSRTLLVEIDVDNRKGELLPGALAQVHFKATAMQTFIVPVRQSSSAARERRWERLAPTTRAHGAGDDWPG